MVDKDVLRTAFSRRWPHAGAPDFCRAPGRVNLIGEHLDYNGLPVLPVTLAESVWIAFAPSSDGLVHMASLDGAYPAVEFANGSRIAPSPTGAWENYAKAAVQGLNEHLGLDTFPGMQLLTTGDLPAAAGLSSSSALVVACALAYLRVLGIRLDDDLDRRELAACLAEAEHYVGTRGGGMDQAAILCAEADHACKIDFFPLRVERVPLPASLAWVVCDSLVRAEKTGAALARYNAGPALSGLAAALVRRKVHEDFGEEVLLERLGDLCNGHLCLTRSEMASLCDEAIPEDVTSVDDAASRLGMTPEAVQSAWLGELPVPAEGLPLRARLRHIVSEFGRVEAARDALLAGDGEFLGELLNASHASCAHDYGISCEALDALTKACRDAGAMGARLTGAGFGGAGGAQAPREKTAELIARLDDTLYTGIPEAARSMRRFVVTASAGAGYTFG